MQRRILTLTTALLTGQFLIGCMPLDSGSSSSSSSLQSKLFPSTSNGASPTPQPNTSAYSTPTPRPSATSTPVVVDEDGESGTARVYGKITFESVPVTEEDGLDYAHSTDKPVRGAVIEIVDSSSKAILASGSTNDSGEYSLSVAEGKSVFVRVKAQMYKSGTASWDFRVVDNTHSKALYALESSSLTVAANGTKKNLRAASGWNGSSYSSSRAAAPFAILDVVKRSLDRALTAKSTLQFPLLRINWSPSNKPTSGSTSKGEIGTSHFNPNENQLYILGADGTDTDEFDSNVVAHEWGHYFEHNFSRSDSLGGSHSLSVRIDPRLAFSEAFGNAFSAMATGSKVYSDSGGAKQAETQLSFDVSSGPTDGARRGWFNEASVQAVIYGVYSAASDGFKAIYDVMSDNVKNSVAFSTIHTFSVAISKKHPSLVPHLAILLLSQSIALSPLDDFDSSLTEKNDGGTAYSLPIYTVLTKSNSPRLCTTGAIGSYNRLGLRRFFYFKVSTAGTYKVTVKPDATSGDPALAVYKNGIEIASAVSKGVGTNETVSMSLQPGTYAGEIYDSRQTDDARNSNECFRVVLE